MGDNSNINDGTTTNYNNVTTMTPEEIAQKIQEVITTTRSEKRSLMTEQEKDEFMSNVSNMSNMTQQDKEAFMANILPEESNSNSELAPGLDNGMKLTKKPKFVKTPKRTLNM